MTVTNTAHLRPGEYICVRTTGPVAALIALITRSRYTHVAVVASVDTVIEAEPGGVRVASLDEYDGRLMICNAAEPTTIAQRAAVVAYAKAQLGVAYNWDADLVDGLEHLGWRWRFLAKFAAGRKAVMCSQLVAAAGVSAGLTGWQCGKPTTAEVVPGDLAARIKKREW